MSALLENMPFAADADILNPSPSVTDALIERCLSGDVQAYNLLYQRHASYIYRLVYNLLRHKEDAEEVLQDTFEYAFRRLDHFDARKSAFKTWLSRIAVSRCRNKRRRKWLPTFSINQANYREDEPAELEIPDHDTPAPDAVSERNDQQAMIWEALGELSAKLRETAVLRYYEGLSYQEIGQILEIPPKTAESRMRLAHKALRKSLAGKV